MNTMPVPPEQLGTTLIAAVIDAARERYGIVLSTADFTRDPSDTGVRIADWACPEGENKDGMSILAWLGWHDAHKGVS